MILMWQENLGKDEVPPEWMWSLDDELESWFEDVEEAREAKFGGSSTRNKDEVVPMMQNQLSKNRRKAHGR